MRSIKHERHWQSHEYPSVKIKCDELLFGKGRRSYVLIDTGYEDDWDLFRTRLKEADVELFQISHIVLTHHHDDHCGLLHNILWENDSIRVVMSHLCKDLIRKGENDRTHGGGFLNRRVALLMYVEPLLLSLILKKSIDREIHFSALSAA